MSQLAATGDRGQRYEIWCDDGAGEAMLIGWSNQPDSFKDLVEKHPTWSNRRVVDRGGARLPLPLRYTKEESEAANAEWKATCGPHAIAAACGLTLADVRAVLEGYRGWMSPTQVTAALQSLGRGFELVTGLKTGSLAKGISRIQWEGPWLDPGVPARVAYHHTHYVAHFRGWVLCTGCLSAEWIEEADWRYWHLSESPPFHVTHHWKMEDPQ